MAPLKIPTEQEIASHLLALRDDKGNDPFIRYQDGMASKGWLRHLIARCIVKAIMDKQNENNRYPDVTISDCRITGKHMWVKNGRLIYCMLCAKEKK